MQKNKIVLKREVLQVFTVQDSVQGHTIEWKIGQNVNSYQLIGILETIKQDLIDDINENSGY